jgi:hypothetical protein
MENQIYLAPVPKRNKYFQEIPIILNSFHSKHLHKLSFPHPSKEPMQSSPHRRLSDLTLPNLRQEVSPLSFTNSKKIHFIIQGSRKTTKTRIRKAVLPAGGQKWSKRPMREIALGTDFEEELDRNQQIGF